MRAPRQFYARRFLRVVSAVSSAGPALVDLPVALAFGWLVLSASRGVRGAAGAVLEARPIVFVGKIGYGLYVYHFFMPVVFAAAGARLGWAPLGKGLIPLLVFSTASLAVAAASWRLFEKPINDLKRHFAYEPHTREASRSERARSSLAA